MRPGDSFQGLKCLFHLAHLLGVPFETIKLKHDNGLKSRIYSTPLRRCVQDIYSTTRLLFKRKAVSQYNKIVSSTRKAIRVLLGKKLYLALHKCIL